MATAVRPAVLSSAPTVARPVVGPVVRAVPLALLLAGLSGVVVAPAASAAEAAVAEQAVLAASSAGAERGRSASEGVGTDEAGTGVEAAEGAVRPTGRHRVVTIKDRASSWSTRPVVVGTGTLAADLGADGTPPGSSGT